MRILILFLFITNIFANEFNNTDINTDIDSDTYESDVYTLDLPQNITEENISENVNEEIIHYTDNINIAIILDKKKFFKFIPSILNSINAYMIKKDINYNIKLFDKNDSLDEITSNYKYIFAYFTNADEVKVLEKYSENYFFIPTLSKNQVSSTSKNIFFGGIDYKKQISKLNQFISDKTIIIYEDKDLSKYITTLINEQLLEPVVIRKYPIKYTKEYNNIFVYLNTNIINTAQILANFTYHQIETKAILTTQINYTPLLFSLTNKDSIKNVILANSIFNISPVIEDNNNNVGSDIKFNWLNYTTSVLLNLAYNLQTDENRYFLNDFILYIFNNQVEYKVNLYKVFKNGFIKIED